MHWGQFSKIDIKPLRKEQGLRVVRTERGVRCRTACQHCPLAAVPRGPSCPHAKRGGWPRCWLIGVALPWL